MKDKWLLIVYKDYASNNQTHVLTLKNVNKKQHEDLSTHAKNESYKTGSASSCLDLMSTIIIFPLTWS